MNTVSISEIVAKNYKNIRLEKGIEFGDLTVLIGANGSGKSNLISLFEFLQDSVAGTIVDDQRGRTNFEEKAEIIRRFRQQFWGQIEEGSIRPVIDTVMPVAEAHAAHEHMRDYQNIGKIVLKVR